ncbi:hypothetical protein [Actinoplanes sp. NPDC049265]|uniref:DUF6197 family protein n=1 Tax=Actinoplanes sp. NPDC049265 TaxID=3363902 RepID=UPI00371AEA47
MNPTQKQDNPDTGRACCPDCRDDQLETFGQNELDQDRIPTLEGFTVWQKQHGVACTHGYTVTEAGLLELAKTSGQEPSHDGGPATPVSCSRKCGESMPGVYAWDVPFCPDCVIAVPANNKYGYVVTAPEPAESTCPVDLVTETDDETAARVLRSAATYLERHGWIQGTYYDATSGSFTPPACLVGAISMVCYGGPVDAPAHHFDDPGFLDFEAAVLHLDRYLLAENGSESYDFNDAKGRRLEDVTHVLRDAAARPAHELIDALRAIDKKNADQAALADLLTRGGIWAADQTAEKVTSPHGECPNCGSTELHVLFVLDDGDGYVARCENPWHTGDHVVPRQGGDA